MPAEISGTGIGKDEVPYELTGLRALFLRCGIFHDELIDGLVRLLQLGKRSFPEL